MPADEDDRTDTVKTKIKAKAWKRLLLLAPALISVVAIGLGLFVGYRYTSSPAVIRKPLMEHYHFRLQVVVNDKLENFGLAKYQTGYSKDQCNGLLAVQPIHFHDNKDQFVHIHWEGMTGGLVLKYYGWNFVGGSMGALGYRFDKRTSLAAVPIHGNVLPTIPKDANFYIYTGDERGFKERSFEDFTQQDLEVFLGKTSNSPGHILNKKQTSLLDTLFPKAYAHGGEDHAAPVNDTETEAERLTRINNLLGNVVIFVQKDEPTTAQITERFSKLLPLSDSTCGG